MRLCLPRAVRRWRWEWVAVLLAIACYSYCGYSCARYLFFRPEITAEESKVKFDSRISEVQTILQSYDIRLYEDKPWDGTRYMRRISRKFSKGKLDISLENQSGGEQYMFKMETMPGGTPEQALPDAESIQMLAGYSV